MHADIADAARLPCLGVAGGVVNPATFTDKVLKDAINQASIDARGNGRSVGDHGSCGSMFDSTTKAAMEKIEKSTISKYNLGQCCS